MAEISLVLSDLDGTLFHDDKTVSLYTKDVIARAQKKGILFGISTSRALVNANKFWEGITPDVLITNGGGLVIYKEKKIYSCEFTVSEIRALIKASFEILGRDAVISVDNESGLYSNSREELGDKFWTFNDFSDFKEPAMKMCIQTLDRDKVEKVAASIGTEKVDLLPFSDIPWYKLSKKDATKERAIQSLCAYLGIPLEKVAAFGDDFSDIGMLKLCGRGVAMQNAIAEVKAIADEICDSNQNDGVAKWMESLLAV